MGLFVYGGESIGMDGKAQLGGNTKAAEHTKGILFETVSGSSHAADDAVAQVALTVEGVNDNAERGVGHGVYGEIPAGEILAKAVGIADAGGMAVIGIVAVGAVGGYFDIAAGDFNGNSSVFQTGCCGSFRRRGALPLFRI